MSDGSVFRLHAEAKKSWIEWETDFEPKQDDPPEKHHSKGSFFHHSNKTPEEAKADDPKPEPSKDEHKHRFLKGRFFHHAK